MISTLAILLYLNAIVSPAQYTGCEIVYQENLHHQEIMDVQANEALYNYVQAEYDDDAESIVVIDDSCLK